MYGGRDSDHPDVHVMMLGFQHILESWLCTVGMRGLRISRPVSGSALRNIKVVAIIFHGRWEKVEQVCCQNVEIQ